MAVEFSTKIVDISNGSRFQITIPKKLVDAHIIDPEKEYIVSLKEKPKSGAAD